MSCLPFTKSGLRPLNLSDQIYYHGLLSAPRSESKIIVGLCLFVCPQYVELSNLVYRLIGPRIRFYCKKIVSLISKQESILP